MHESVESVPEGKWAGVGVAQHLTSVLINKLQNFRNGAVCAYCQQARCESSVFTIFLVAHDATDDVEVSAVL